MWWLPIRTAWCSSVSNERCVDAASCKLLNVTYVMLCCVECAVDEFSCKNHFDLTFCIPASHRCNFYTDCIDVSDESDCLSQSRTLRLLYTIKQYLLHVYPWHNFLLLRQLCLSVHSFINTVMFVWLAPMSDRCWRPSVATDALSNRCLAWPAWFGWLGKLLKTCWQRDEYCNSSHYLASANWNCKTVMSVIVLTHLILSWAPLIRCRHMDYVNVFWL